MLEKESSDNTTGLEIAVIGMAGQFPGAQNIKEFWENLKNGVESISFFTGEELKEAGVETETLESPNYVKAGGFLENKTRFDSLFFGHTPTEAELMAPQIRIFHEMAWHALEDAAYVPGAFKGKIGVYGGASSSINWEMVSLLSGKQDIMGTFAAMTYVDKDQLATRICYNLNLRGPALTVQTACSTGLVAIHLAYQALLSGECDMALAGAVTLFTTGKQGYFYQEGGIYSADGHCKTFDADAGGSIATEGGGVVILKTLEDAIDDNDNIYAVIKGSAINNDGRTKVGYIATSARGQAAVIYEAYQSNEIDPATIGYIETHGVGTPMGDSIELEALKSVFKILKKNSCPIGSVKTNVGHMITAAGITAFIKTVLMLKHRQIPPSLHFQISNSRIDLENSPFYVNRSLQEWKNDPYPLRAGVSSFGIGGTNAHVILEEAPHFEGTRGLAPLFKHQLILLSAKTETALEKMTENLAQYLKNNPGINLVDAAYTLQVGREAFNHRKTFTCSSVTEAVEILTGKNPGRVFTSALEGAVAGGLPGNVGSIPDDPVHLDKIGRSWCNGMEIDWASLYRGEKVSRISLPTYPFDDWHYPVDGNLLEIATRALVKKFPSLEKNRESQDGTKEEVKHPLLDHRLEKNPDETVYVTHFRVNHHWVLDEHRVLGKPTLPGTACLEMARAAYEDRTGREYCELQEVYFFTPMRVEEDEEREVHTVLKKYENRCKFTVSSRVEPGEDKWLQHAAGEIVDIVEPGLQTARTYNIRELMKKCGQSEQIISKEMLETGKGKGALSFVWGRRWENIKQVNIGDNQVLTLLELPGDFADECSQYKLHPALLDSAAGYYNTKKDVDEASFPFSFKKINIKAPMSSRIYSYQRYENAAREGERILEYNITIMNDRGVELVEIEEYKRLVASERTLAQLSQGTVLSPAATPRGPLLPRPNLEEAYVAPTNEIEKKIVEIWQKFLGIQQIGLYDDFFELGGDSVRIMTIASKIHKSFNVEMPLRELFNNPTAAGIAAYINRAKKVKYFDIQLIEKKEYYPLSSAQMRMFILYQLNKYKTSDNIPQVMIAKGQLDIGHLNESVAKLIERHETLRTSFELVDNTPFQFIHQDVDFKVSYMKAERGDDDEINSIIEKFIRPFDLGQAPLLRVGLLKLARDKHLFMYDLHHIICDGISLTVVMEEFSRIYHSLELPELTVQYKDFAAWQNKFLQSDTIKKQEEYWLSRFEGELPVLNMPTDFPRPELQSFEGDCVRFELDEELSEKIRMMARESGITLYMLLLSIYFIFLSKYSGQEDIVVGTAIAGRPHENLENLVGMFANTLALRNYPKQEKTYRQFLEEIKFNTLKAYENQDYQFEYLVERLGIQRDTARHPLFDTMLVGHNTDFIVENPGREINGLHYQEYKFEEKYTQFDIIIHWFESNNLITSKLLYCTRLFKKKTIEKFVQYLKEIASTVVDNPGIKLKDIKVSHRLLSSKTRMIPEDDGDFIFRQEVDRQNITRYTR